MRQREKVVKWLEMVARQLETGQLALGMGERRWEREREKEKEKESLRADWSCWRMAVVEREI